MAQLREDVRALCMKAGTRNMEVVFIVGDTHLMEETFLVCISGILAAGIVQDMFPLEDREEILAALRCVQ